MLNDLRSPSSDGDSLNLEKTMHSKKVSPGVAETLLTSEVLGVDPEMIDTDQGRAPYLSGASIQEGCSGHKPIDTMYENTSQDVVDNPREGSTPAPVCLNSGMFPHRRL